jgi:hypothetical protein
MSDEERKRQLALELTRARASISRGAAGVRYGLDFPNRVKASVKGSPVVWVAGAVGALGLISLLVPWRRRREVPPNVWSDLGSRFGRPRPAAAKVAGGGAIVGIVLTAARFLLPLVQPAILSFIKSKVSNYTGGGEKRKTGM